MTSAGEESGFSRRNRVSQDGTDGFGDTGLVFVAVEGQTQVYPFLFGGGYLLASQDAKHLVSVDEVIRITAHLQYQPDLEITIISCFENWGEQVRKGPIKSVRTICHACRK